MNTKRHAFVTGAGTGIGKAIAIALASSGHIVTLAGRRSAPLQAVSTEIVNQGGEASVIDNFDVSSQSTVESGVTAAIKLSGDIAVLVNCAGEAPSAPFDKTSLEVWNRVIATNLTGAFLTTQAALPSLRRSSKGRIINIASTAGLIAYPYVSAYCASKHGLIGLTRALALELARSEITVNAVCPGFTDTPLLDNSVELITSKTGRSSSDARATLARGNPQGRLIAPQEVAAIVQWLAGDNTSSITGQSIVVAGGEVMSG